MTTAAESAAERKTELRRQCRSRAVQMLREITEDQDKTICDLLTSMREYRLARTVFCYISLPGEADTKRLCQKVLSDGKRLAVPVVMGGGKMTLKIVTSLESLRCKDKFGIPAPDEDAEPVDAGEIDFSVIPGICFSPDCARLGRGGGYYDRFLSEYRGFSAGLCRSWSLVDKIPEERHDQRVSAVVTDTGIIYNQDKPLLTKRQRLQPAYSAGL